MKLIFKSESDKKFYYKMMSRKSNLDSEIFHLEKRLESLRNERFQIIRLAPYLIKEKK